MKSFETVGIWFLPESPDTKIGGTLTFSKEKGLVLTLSGSFRGDWNIEGSSYPLVHGVVSESPYGRFVSLFDCFATNLRMGMPGISVETIRANHGYAGSDFVDSDAMQFDEAMFAYSTLGAWLNYSGLQINHVSKGVEVKWQTLPPVRCKVAGATISAGIGLDTEGGALGGFFSLKEKPMLTADEFGSLTAAEIHSKLAGPLTMLLTFASDAPVDLERYELFKSTDDSIPSMHFDRLYSPVGESNRSSPKRSHDLLFTYSDVKERFEPFMSEWFSFVENHPDFCTMFFSYGYEKHGFVETRFLFLMQAIECLIQDETSETADVLQEFQFARQLLSPDSELAARPYLSYAIPTVRQYAIPSLLANAIGENWSLVERLVGTTQDRFLEVLLSTFHYVMHRGVRGETVRQGSDLLWLQQRLAAVIKILVLKRLKFTDDEITDIIARNGEMNHLKFISAPWNTSE